jgi:Zn-dependent protease with chaperone function
VIRIRGRWYDGRTSAGEDAEVMVTPSGMAHLHRTASDAAWHFKALRVSERVGSTPRRLYFPDGGQLETPDNDAVDAALAASGRQRAARWVHALESRWHYVLIAAVIIAGAAWGLVRYGIPAGARLAAFALPAETSQAIGQGALELMDRALFAPSQLDEAERRRVQRLFEGVARHEAGLPLKLELRRGQRVGANAFALPSGTVVLTDELVKLAQHDGEIVAVLAHEAGHVARRHALRRVIQGSVVALIVVMVTGDVSSTSSLIAALPTVLVETQYSRAFEHEADQHALEHLLARRLDPAHFSNFMRRLEATRPGDSKLPEWVSTHPASGERIRRFESAAGAPTP